MQWLPVSVSVTKTCWCSCGTFERSWGGGLAFSQSGYVFSLTAILGGIAGGYYGFIDGVPGVADTGMEGLYLGVADGTVGGLIAGFVLGYGYYSLSTPSIAEQNAELDRA